MELRNSVTSGIIFACMALTPIQSFSQQVSQEVMKTLSSENDSNPLFVQAQKDFAEALQRLQKNPHFWNYSIRESIMLAIMEKESHFNPAAESSSGAIWYFWLKADAETDAKDFLHDSLRIRGKTYEKEEAVDNIILGICYYIKIKKQIETLSEEIDISGQEDILTLLAYNAWVGTVGKLVILYKHETQSEDLTWDEFATWIVKKMDLSWVPIPTKDSNIYHIEYRDWFDGKNFSNTLEEEIIFSSTLSIPKSKIKEMLDYVEKIAAIQTRENTRAIIFWNTMVKRSPENFGDSLFVSPRSGEGLYTFLKRNGLEGPLAVWVFLDINNVLFETNLTESWKAPELQAWQSYKLPVLSYELWTNESLESVLEKAQIASKFRQKIIDFNTIFSPDFEKFLPGSRVYIPQWNTGFYTAQETFTPIVQKTAIPQAETLSETDFNFTTWIESIEVLGDALKGKVFILDPGHGGPDLWAHPIARDGNGNPINDPQSQIKVARDRNGNLDEGKTQRVASGNGDDFLHVYESLVVTDVSYRLAKLLREQGAEVYITRYNKTTGIIDSANMTTPDIADDIYSDTLTSWVYSSNGQNKRLQHGVKIAKKIYKEKIDQELNLSKDVYFLSLHADSLSTHENAPIVFKYYEWRDGISQLGKDFAQKLASNTEFREIPAQADGQWLYIVNPRNNDIPNSLLIELGNMHNPGTAYILRQPGWKKDADGNPIRGREDFAKAIFDGIIKTLSN